MRFSSDKTTSLLQNLSKNLKNTRAVASNVFLHLSVTLEQIFL